MRDSLLKCLLLFYVLSIASDEISSQNLNPEILKTFEYEDLLSLFNEYNGDSINQEQIARTYISKARTEEDTIKMARGYDRLARIFHFEKNMMFADSVILLTDGLRHKTYPAMGYILKGYLYDQKMDFINSNKNYVKAYGIAKRQKNLQQEVHVMQHLIASKIIWGDKHDALKLQHAREKIIRSPDYINILKKLTRSNAQLDIDQLYINELLSSNTNYVFCHLNLKNYDSTRFYLKEGKRLLNKYSWLDKQGMVNWYMEVEMELSYYEHKYERVVEIARTLLKKQEQIEPYSKMNVNYYLGLALTNLHGAYEGVEYLIRADSLVDTFNLNLLPKDRNLFVSLNKYYKSVGDVKNRIKYLRKLIKADSLVKINLKYFEPSMIRNIETPQLIHEKEQLISALEERNRDSLIINLAIVILFILSITSMIYYMMRRRKDKIRFDSLIARTSKSNGIEKHQYSYDISSDVINSILKKLKEFEQDQEFLSTDISLQRLAKLFDSNANYLSRVINLKIGKNFSQYINDLRIDYAVGKISNDKKFRKYTIKAIGEECGYRNAESFSKAFYRRYKIYPSNYINKLNKTEAKQ
ncbi:MAG: AraC family transcriptional regulator [Flavobacterium sp.]|nr:MAG: AraC family transcriptional regulator [Flavobacterium sp.]